MLGDLIVAWVSVFWHFMTTSSNKMYDQKKKRIISIVYFSVTAVTSWHSFSRSYVLFSIWAPLLLTFVQIGVLLLFYATVCFHLEDKSVFVCSVYAVLKGRRSNRSIRTEIWQTNLTELFSELRVERQPSLC